MSSETWTLRSNVLRERVIGLIMAAQLVDEKGRALVVELRRERTAFGASKKRRFHAYVNLLAEYREVPAEAMKATLKAHLCPLVERVDVITGEVTFSPKSIAELDDDEASALCEKVVQLAGEQWELPLPASEQEWDVVKTGGLQDLLELRAISAENNNHEE